MAAKKIAPRASKPKPWEGVDWGAILDDANGRALLRVMGGHAARNMDEIAEAIWIVNSAAFRFGHRRDLKLPNMTREVLLALHASLVDTDREQMTQLWELSRRILRTGSATAQEHGRNTGAALARAADWGTWLRDTVEVFKPHTAKEGAFEGVIALFMESVPAFRDISSSEAKSKLVTWFQKHPDRLATETPADLAEDCCVALGMRRKTANNAIKVSPAMRNKSKRLKKKQV